MDVRDAIKNRRTIRKFDNSRKIEYSILKDLIDSARLAPSASNYQPLKYIIVDDEKIVNEVYKNVRWARYLAPAPYHDETGRPTAFIVVLIDTDIRQSGYEFDIGAAVENILLTACSYEIGACWMGQIDRTSIRKILNIPYRYMLNTVIALGYKDENPIVEAMDEKDEVKYYKDNKGTLHVPKRKTEDVILNFID